MTNLQIYTAIGLAIYGAILIAIVYFAKRDESQSGFMIGARKIGLFQTTAGIIGAFRDAGGVVALTAWIFLFGTAFPLLAVAAYVLGLGLFAWRAGYIHDLAVRENFVTISEMITMKIGRRTAMISSIVILIAAFLSAITQLYVGGNIFSQMAGIEYSWGVVSIATLVAIYLTIGGYKAVARTDAFQFLIILSILIVPFFLSYDTEKLAMQPLLHTMKWYEIIAFPIMSAAYFFCAPDLWQRCFAARDRHVAKRGFINAIIIMCVVLGAISAMGYSLLSQFPDAPSHEAFFYLFKPGVLPIAMTAVIGLFMVAALISTLDTKTFLFVTTIIRDFLQKEPASQKRREEFIAKAKMGVPLLLLILSVIAITVGDVVQFILNLASVLMTLAPTIFIAAFRPAIENPARDKAFAYAIPLSCAMAFTFYGFGLYKEIIFVTIPMIFCAIVTYLLMKIMVRKDQTAG